MPESVRSCAQSPLPRYTRQSKQKAVGNIRAQDAGCAQTGRLPPATMGIRRTRKTRAAREPKYNFGCRYAASELHQQNCRHASSLFFSILLPTNADRVCLWLFHIPYRDSGLTLCSASADSSTDSSDCLSKYMRCQTSIIKRAQIFRALSRRFSS